MFNREILETVKAHYDAKRDARQREAEERRALAEEKNPALKAVGERIRATAVLVLQESMKGGEDLKERVLAIGRETVALREQYLKLLEEMGLPRDYCEVRYDCRKCEDTGIANGERCACMTRELVRETWRNSGIGRLIERQRFDNFDLSYYSTALLPDKRYSPRDVMTALYRDVVDWAEHFTTSSPSLLFIGGTGLGKTHLSSALAGKVMEKGFDVVYESAPAVAALFEKDRFGNEEGTGERIRRLMDAELLILDDLGTEPASATSNSAFYQLINHRASLMGLPTVISTNLTHRELEKQYDTAIVSRLLGEFEVKVFAGADVRMAKLR